MSTSNGKIGAEASQAAHGGAGAPELDDDPESTTRWEPSVLSEKLTDVVQTANSALNGVADAVGLTEKVEASPYGMVAAALGLGYVVGGGLFTPTTLRLVKMGLKLSTIPMVRDRLLDFAEAAVDGVMAEANRETETDDETEQ